MVEEEKIHREQVLEAKYRDMSNLETKFTQLIENEIGVRFLNIEKSIKNIYRPEKIVILDLLELSMNVSIPFEET